MIFAFDIDESQARPGTTNLLDFGSIDGGNSANKKSQARTGTIIHLDLKGNHIRDMSNIVTSPNGHHHPFRLGVFGIYSVRVCWSQAQTGTIIHLDLAGGPSSQPLGWSQAQTGTIIHLDPATLEYIVGLSKSQARTGTIIHLDVSTVAYIHTIHSRHKPERAPPTF